MSTVAFVAFLVVVVAVAYTSPAVALLAWFVVVVGPFVWLPASYDVRRTTARGERCVRITLDVDPHAWLRTTVRDVGCP